MSAYSKFLEFLGETDFDFKVSHDSENHELFIYNKGSDPTPDNTQYSLNFSFSRNNKGTVVFAESRLPGESVGEIGDFVICEKNHKS